MSLDGRSRRRACCAGSTTRQRRQVLYVNVFPNLLRQPAPRLRDDPPHRAGHAGPQPWSSASGCSRPRRWSGPASTRATPSTSGTSPTARTGPRSRACSAAWRSPRFVPGVFSRGRGRRVPLRHDCVARRLPGPRRHQHRHRTTSTSTIRTRSARMSRHRRPAGRGRAAGPDGRADGHAVGRGGRRRRAQRAGPRRPTWPGPAVRARAGAHASASAARARSSARSPTRATSCRPAPTSSACSTRS